MINDLFVYSHDPVSLVGRSVNNVDFQVILQQSYNLVNRTTTVPLVINNVRDLVTCEVTTGKQSSGLLNQNTAVDGTIWIPTLPGTEAIDGWGSLEAMQRVTFTYQGLTADTFAPLQTAFLGHGKRDPNFTPAQSVRIYASYTRRGVISANGITSLSINIQPTNDMLVRYFVAIVPRLAVRIQIYDKGTGYNVCNVPTYAELIAYTNLGEAGLFRAPFLPWIAPARHEYIIVFQADGNVQTDTPIQFGFVGELLNSNIFGAQ